MGKHSTKRDWKKYFRRTIAVGSAATLVTALTQTELAEKILPKPSEITGTGTIPVFPALDLPTQAIPSIAAVAEQQQQQLKIGDTLAQALPTKEEFEKAAEPPTEAIPIVQPPRNVPPPKAKIETPVANTAISVGGNSIAEIAIKLAALPTPYVYGGGSLTTGIDCSHFVWEVYKRAGYKFPYRTSASLKAWATPITKSQAQPGDLVFWPGHVGIYVGNGKVADAGNSVVDTLVRPLFGSPTYGRIPR